MDELDSTGRATIAILWLLCGPLACKSPATNSVDNGECQEGHCVVVTLATGQGRVSDVASDGINVYWSSKSQSDMNPIGSIAMVSVDGGTPVVLASAPGDPTSIAIDKANVYWTDFRSGTVSSVPKNGGSVATLATGQASPEFIAVNESSVFWTSIGSGESCLGNCSCTCSNGTAVTGIVTGACTCNEACSRATPGTTGTGSCGSAPSSGGTIVKASLGGGGLTTLAMGQKSAQGIAVNSFGVFWAAYVAGSLGGVLMEAPLAGGEPTTVVSGQRVNVVGDVAADDGNVFMANGSDVTKVDVAKGTSEVLFPKVDASSIALDATHVYWTTGSSIVRAPRSGGPTTELASASSAFSIAVDAHYVYWGEYDTGNIVRVQR